MKRNNIFRVFNKLSKTFRIGTHHASPFVMHRKLSCRHRNGAERIQKKRGAVFLIFFLLLLLWTFPIRPNPYGPLFSISSTDPLGLGKARFYSLLQQHLEGCAFSENIRGLLFEPERKHALYDHLMSFYYYAAQMREPLTPRLSVEEPGFSRRILELSTDMALELIYDIKIRYSQDSEEHIFSLLQSTGIFTPRMKPIYRRFSSSFFRPLPLRTKGQDILDDLGIRAVHQHTTRGKNISLAIIDSGMDPTFKELKSRLGRHRDFLNGEIPLQHHK